MSINVKNIHILVIMFVIVQGVESIDNCSHLLLETIYQSERCYWKSGRLLNFTESQKICQSDGGILAEIPDSSTEDAVKQKWLAVIGNYWIGIHDMYAENAFVNMLNESITYTNWDFDQPNNVNDIYKNADCVLVRSTGWIDTMCGLEYGAVCSKAIMPKMETTNVPTTTSETTTIVTTSTAVPTTQRISLVSNNEAQMTTTVPQARTSLATTSSVEITPTGTALECVCLCTRMDNVIIIANETQLKMKIEAMKKALFVNKTLLSSSLRRRISASDSRISAAIIGTTLGVTIIVLVMVLIIVSDARHLYNDFKNGICRCSSDE
ncbi:uncharacterized protein LOC130047969 [Ostrea edulis]|uniref:uncharacterized protein LOC130047969 n=1 Tax=Ostrea edulis TaxID=37623 RepID=UPI0024AEF420|nr:uncharacterized protein LOC130047969 [Ostrea edulis]